jgi:hypothetical protein
MNRVLAAGALAVFIAAIVAIALASLGSGDGGTSAATTKAATTSVATRTQPPKTKPKPPTRIKLVAVGPYDPPPGDGTENDSQVPNAVDGNVSTFWSTEHYSSPLGTYKQGVGIVFDAGRRRAIGRVLVSTDEPGARAEIELADVPTGPYHVVSADKVLTGATSIPLKRGAAGRYVLVWVTALPPTAREAHVNEVRAFST